MIDFMFRVLHFTLLIWIVVISGILLASLNDFTTTKGICVFFLVMADYKILLRPSKHT